MWHDTTPTGEFNIATAPWPQGIKVCSVYRTRHQRRNFVFAATSCLSDLPPDGTPPHTSRGPLESQNPPLLGERVSGDEHNANVLHVCPSSRTWGTDTGRCSRTSAGDPQTKRAQSLQRKRLDKATRPHTRPTCFVFRLLTYLTDEAPQGTWPGTACGTFAIPGSGALPG